MSNRLAEAVSPYLRSHADNPVDWREWGDEAFAEAERRNVPLLVSIGYSTCHWCHVMARESFSDPAIAAQLNDGFVAIKVDREEYPDVDASYLAAAGAFTPNLGWPLNVFVTPQGRAFYAGTYYPPEPMQQQPSFSQILSAVREAWQDRHDEVQQNAAAVAAAIAGQLVPDAGTLPGGIAPVVDELAANEDELFGGFGAAPKFPIAPVLNFLLASGQPDGVALANRALDRMAGSPLRDEVEGGFFRYSTMRDWSDPHYERMLYDNAQLLDAYTRSSVFERAGEDAAAGGKDAAAGGVDGSKDAGLTSADVAAGIAGFLLGVLQLPAGGFASAQDSESLIDGRSSEGGYYQLTAEQRTAQTPPKLDEKIISGWNGLAISALARAGVVFNRGDWIDGARRAADYLLEQHLQTDRLVRVSIEGRISAARATLEDYGMLAGGLLQLALATGEARYAIAGRELLDATLAASAEHSASEHPAAEHPDLATTAAEHPDLATTAAEHPDLATTAAELPSQGHSESGRPDASPFAAPGGADPVLTAQGLAIAVDPSEGAYPSGLSACALAADTLYSLTGDARYREAARDAAALVAGQAAHRPLGYGATLEVLARLATETVQMVVVTPQPEKSGELVAAARTIPASVTSIVSERQASEFAAAGFELFEGRTAQDGLPTAYLCRDFTCSLPVTSASQLALS